MSQEGLKELNQPLLQLGTLGWSAGFETADFYPDDLPEEWRLTYLSNEVDRVALTVEVVLAADEEQIEEWAEDTHEQFGFLLLYPSGGPLDPLLQRLRPLGEKLVGAVAVENMEPLTVDASFREEIRQFQGGDGVAILTPREILSPAAVRAVVERLRAREIDTLLITPTRGFVANLSNFETISSLLG